MKLGLESVPQRWQEDVCRCPGEAAAYGPCDTENEVLDDDDDSDDQSRQGDLLGKGTVELRNSRVPSSILFGVCLATLLSQLSKYTDWLHLSFHRFQPNSQPKLTIRMFAIFFFKRYPILLSSSLKYVQNCCRLFEQSSQM